MRASPRLIHGGWSGGELDNATVGWCLVLWKMVAPANAKTALDMDQRCWLSDPRSKTRAPLAKASALLIVCQRKMKSPTTKLTRMLPQASKATKFLGSVPGSLLKPALLLQLRKLLATSFARWLAAAPRKTRRRSPKTKQRRMRTRSDSSHQDWFTTNQR